MGVSCLREGKPEVLLLFLILWPYVCISLLISRKLGIVIKENHYIFILLKKPHNLLGYMEILSPHCSLIEVQ